MVKVLDKGDAQLSYTAYCLVLGEEFQARCSNPKFHNIQEHMYTTHRYNTQIFISSAHFKGYTRNSNTVHSTL